ncbi:hypothetical protein B0A55_03871 [Friedmanniomyces simplex]|uniref:Uncharacterized protein n=1 Tax=Friedmanniomyces simplex TaxID=329884 RepID=A0A4U0XQ41_9PEZI|nr:hypothetical protein B0A55_03871 [Friedmanniomyces simplex]
MATLHERCLSSLKHTRHAYTHFYIDLLRSLPNDIYAGSGLHHCLHASTAILPRCAPVFLSTSGYFLAIALSFLSIYAYAHSQAVLRNALFDGSQARPPPPAEVRTMAYLLSASFAGVVMCQERSMGLYPRLALGVSVYAKSLFLTVLFVCAVRLAMGIGKAVARGLYWPEGLNEPTDDAAKLAVAHGSEPVAEEAVGGV